MDSADFAPESLERLAAVLASAQATRSRLEKRRILVAYLQALPEEALPAAVTFLTGRPFPRADGRRLSVGGATLAKALLAASPGLTPEKLEAAWLRHSDAGDTAADVWVEVPIPAGPPLTVTEMADRFVALHQASGPTQKIPVLAEAFRRMSPAAIRAFVKVMLGETRSGLGEGTIEDAVAHAYGHPLDEVRAANRHKADLGAVAMSLRGGSRRPRRVRLLHPGGPHAGPASRRGRRGDPAAAGPPLLARPEGDHRPVPRRGQGPCRGGRPLCPRRGDPGRGGRTAAVLRQAPAAPQSRRPHARCHGGQPGGHGGLRLPGMGGADPPRASPPRPSRTAGRSLPARRPSPRAPRPCVHRGRPGVSLRRRASDYTFAVRDQATGELLTIGKAYGGLTDAEIAVMIERLKAITVAEHGRYREVRPEIVLEVAFNNIQRSNRHISGFALRFPRIVRIRLDKGPGDINTLDDVGRLHAALAGPASGMPPRRVAGR